MENKERKQGLQIQGILVSISLGSVFALIGCCLLLLLCSVAVAAGLIPESNMRNLCVVLCAVCALIGGRFAVKKGYGPPMLISSLTGVMLCALILLIGFMGFQQPSLTGSHLWILFAAFVGAGISGISPPASSKKGKYKKKRKK